MSPSFRRLALHAAVAGGLLFLGLTWVRPLLSFSADEGAAIIQAERVDRGQGWRFPNEVPELDPAGRFVAPPRGDDGSKGHASYAKHPLFPLVLLLARRLTGGAIGYHLVSVAGTVGAALGAGVLARRIDGRAGVPAVWLAALGSPLTFYSQITLAHSAAAGAFAATCVVAVRSSGGRARVVERAALAVLAAATVGLRSEGVIAVLALAAASVVGAGSRRRGVETALWLVAGAASARLAELVFVREVLGAGVQSASSGGTGSFLSDRWHAFRATWLEPSYGVGGAADLLVSLAAVFAAFGGVLGRVRHSPRLLALGLAAAGACLLARVTVGPPSPIPGLLLAFPLGIAGAVHVRREQWRDEPARVIAVTAILAILGILGTQYWFGGGREWGGRFFAIVLPAAVPILAVALVGAVPSREAAWPVVAGAALVAAGLAGVARESLLSTRRATAVVRDALDEAGSVARRHSPGRPVVVSTMYLYPRVAWDRYEDYRWFSVEPGSLGDHAERLANARLPALILVSTDLAVDHEVLSAGYRRVVLTSPPGAALSVAVYVPREAGPTG